MFDEGDLAMQDTAQGEGGGQELTQEWSEPNPADYGISLGADTHLDKCWEHFTDCMKNVRSNGSLEECVAQLDACRRKSALLPDAEAM
jgi:hypothetical protein